MNTGTITDPVLQDVSSSAPAGSCESLHVLRLDTIDPVISGNKWFKLRYNLEAAQAAGCRGLLTFGGAFSNHLLATAAAGNRFGLQTTGIVRGEDAAQNPSSTLQHCSALGMRLVYVSREEYAQRESGTTCQRLLVTVNLFPIPEGGDNDGGRKGAAEIARYIPDWATHVCLPVGSGTTMAGLLTAQGSWQVMGFPALKDESLIEKIRTHANGAEDWSLNSNYTFGGFARTTPELLLFMQDLFRRTGIPTDIVYTGKMMFGVADGLGKKSFPASARIVCIHTGGLQGNPQGIILQNNDPRIISDFALRGK